jgi:ABC-type cobalamin/Fe3+-siderophores transport system ATPase subunit
VTEAGLSLTRASVTVAGRTLLVDIDLRLRGGELVAVVGRNGAGKTTLLRLMAGLVPPSGGEVRLDGRAVTDLAPSERAARIGFLAPARLPVPAGYTVRKVVSWARFARHSWWRTTGVDDPAVERAIVALELEPFVDRRLDTLSDGERQRLWLACLLAQETGYALLDEPTSHLDLSYAIDSLRIIRAWAAEGLGVALVLHDLDAALAVADRIVVVEAGRVALDEPVGAVASEGLGRRLGIRLAEVTLDGRRRVLARGLGEA